MVLLPQYLSKMFSLGWGKDLTLGIMYFSPAWYKTASTFLHTLATMTWESFFLGGRSLLLWMVEQSSHPGGGEGRCAALLKGQWLQLLRPKVGATPSQLGSTLSCNSHLLGADRSSIKRSFKTSWGNAYRMQCNGGEHLSLVVWSKAVFSSLSINPIDTFPPPPPSFYLCKFALASGCRVYRWSPHCWGVNRVQVTVKSLLPPSPLHYVSPLPCSVPPSCSPLRSWSHRGLSCVRVLGSALPPLWRGTVLCVSQV